MKRNMLIVVLGVVLCVWSGAEPDQRPMSFDTASENAREFVLYSITSCVRTASVALVQCRSGHLTNDLIRTEYLNILRLRPCCCLEMFRGKPVLAENSLCYLYDTPRTVTGYPYLLDEYKSKDRVPDEFMFIDKEEPGIRIGRGKSLYWKAFPPYDPYSAPGHPCCNHWAIGNFVGLAFMSPQTEPLMRYVETTPCFISGTNKVLATMGGRDLTKVSPQELVVGLGMEKAFPGSVFRLNEGCLFLVDHPSDDPDRWELSERRLFGDYIFYYARQNCGHLIRLTHEEVSEVVYLVYAANGETAGYATAQRRCADILKPVTEIRTTLGRRLQAMLRDGGMLSRADSESKR